MKVPLSGEWSRGRRRPCPNFNVNIFGRCSAAGDKLGAGVIVCRAAYAHVAVVHAPTVCYLLGPLPVPCEGDAHQNRRVRIRRPKHWRLANKGECIVGCPFITLGENANSVHKPSPLVVVDGPKMHAANKGSYGGAVDRPFRTLLAASADRFRGRVPFPCRVLAMWRPGRGVGGLRQCRGWRGAGRCGCLWPWRWPSRSGRDRG